MCIESQTSAFESWLNSQEVSAWCRSSAAAAPDRASLGSRAVTDRDAELLSGAQDDAKELRSELAKARQRCGLGIALQW